MPESTRTAAEVAAMLEDGKEIAFLDVREIVPFGTGHPLLATHLALGHIECEIAGLVPRRDTRVIVTDGGEGLSVVAAHRLARLGYGNVAVLAGGAPAWAAAGLALFPEIEVPSKGFGDFVAHHARPTFITPPELDRATASGDDCVLIASRAGRRSLDAASREQWRDDTTQTTSVCDVRERDEYEAGHLDGARKAPEGALVMSPGHYIGTQHARCVLVDDDTVRATIAALWLSQMGRCTPYVLDDASLDGALTATGPAPRPVLGLDRAPRATMTPQARQALVRQANPLIIDVGN